MKDRGSAEMQREIHAVAEAVGEIEFGDGKEAVVGAETEDALREIFCGYEHVLMAVNCGFRSAAAAGGIEKEGGIGGARGVSRDVFCVRHGRGWEPIVPG